MLRMLTLELRIWNAAVESWGALTLGQVLAARPEPRKRAGDEGEQQGDQMDLFATAEEGSSHGQVG